MTMCAQKTISGNPLNFIELDRAFTLSCSTAHSHNSQRCTLFSIYVEPVLAITSIIPIQHLRIGGAPQRLLDIKCRGLHRRFNHRFMVIVSFTEQPI